jgi:hypothetical protein
LEPTAEQLREWKLSNARFPEHLVPVAPEHWPDMAGSPIKTGSIAIGAFRSNAFVVVVWIEPNGFTRLSINRTEWDEREGRFRDNIGWDDLQRLKAEAGYGDVPAVELYPPDQHVMNTVNMRHLFLLPIAPPFMWRDTSRTMEGLGHEFR